MNNFLETVNYMASAIDMLQKNTAPTTYRQMAQVTTTASGRSIQTNRSVSTRGNCSGGMRSFYQGGARYSYRGRGGGRLQRGGRGGRFTPRFTPSTQTPTVLTPSTTNTRGGYTPSVARGYSYAEWQSLNNNQRQQIYQERERLNRSMASINIAMDNSLPHDSTILVFMQVK
jgi:hypothetical protein